LEKETADSTGSTNDPYLFILYRCQSHCRKVFQNSFAQ